MTSDQDNRPPASLADEVEAAQVALDAAAAAVGRLAAAVQPDAKPARERPPARQGKKAVAFWVDPGASAQLRMAGISMGRSVQDIMSEALEDWFRKHGLPRLAAEGKSGVEPRSAA